MLAEKLARYEEFFRSVPEFERMLVRSGIKVIKYWFSITDEEQHLRFQMRIHDPIKQWKLSPLDIESIDHWDDYSAAKTSMFFHTDTGDAPWVVIKSDDKKRARVNCMRHFLQQFDYPDRNPAVACAPDPLLVGPASKVAEEAERVTADLVREVDKARREGA